MNRDGKTPGKAAVPRWRRWLIVLSFLGFAVFFCPVFGGIVNPANLGAMGGFLLLAAVFLWWSGFLRLLGWFWTRRWGRVLLLLTGVGLVLLVVLLAVLCCQIVSKLHAVPDAPCRTVVVLGCKVNGTVPSLLLSYRIRTAADYLAANPDAVAILSGAGGWGEEITEAECMHRALVARGIDPSRLYREESSRTTLENLKFSIALMAREGLEGPVLLISNDFHLYRALKMAADLGLPAQGLAAPCSWYSRPTYILREALALVKYAFTTLW